VILVIVVDGTLVLRHGGDFWIAISEASAGWWTGLVVADIWLFFIRGT
jgi:hypothetical protein